MNSFSVLFTLLSTILYFQCHFLEFYFISCKHSDVSFLYDSQSMYLTFSPHLKYKKMVLGMAAFTSTSCNDRQAVWRREIRWVLTFLYHSFSDISHNCLCNWNKISYHIISLSPSLYFTISVHTGGQTKRCTHRLLLNITVQSLWIHISTLGTHLKYMKDM